VCFVGSTVVYVCNAESTGHGSYKMSPCVYTVTAANADRSLNREATNTIHSIRLWNGTNWTHSASKMPSLTMKPLLCT